jgi:flavin reductase (DIM6/NTAB) family NADH-FMN oxidoreductase RutF/DNA-binding MarR family transcriptional regulator
MNDSGQADTKGAALETGDPRDDSRAYRRALGHFATGVTIITTSADGQLGGMTANSFSSVSLDPPLIQWALGKRSQSLSLFRQAERFAVNVLASDQVELASHFARSGGDKFAGVEWQPGSGGAPLFPGVAATFECRTHSTVDAGDHFIVLGEVERFTRNDRPLLLFSHGRFGLAVDYPGVAGDPGPGGSGAEASDTMLGLLWDAFSRMSTGFQAERDAEGMTINQGRVLSIIERHPAATTESIARRAFVSPAAVNDAIGVLVDAGFAVRRDNGGCEVTASGLERVLSLRRRAAAFEARQLAHLTPQELEVARKVLKSLGMLEG